MRYVVTVFIFLIAAAVLGVVGSIMVKAFRNHGLMPQPSPLASYACEGGAFKFSLSYLHGTERVSIRSAAATLDGRIYQNRFDWGALGDDSRLLGFVPPAEIVFEDAQTIRIAGRSFDNLLCVNPAQTSSHRRGIVE